MKKLLCVITLLMISQNVISQNNEKLPTNYRNENISSITAYNGGWVKTNTISDIKGSPYLLENWKSYAKLNVGKKAFILNSLNYNIDKDQFEAKFSEDSVMVINTRNISKINLNNRTFKTYFNPIESRYTFFEELYNKKEVLLLKRYSVKIKEGVIDRLTLKKIRPDEYVKSESYFIKNENAKSLKKIKLKKSILLKTLSEKYSNEVKDYVKKNKLSYSKEKDLKKILNFYSSLIKV